MGETVTLAPDTGGVVEVEVYAGMDPRLPLGEVSAYAQRVERLGYDGLHVAEMVHDPFAAVALAVAATATLGVRTSVALAFVRSPMATALAAWDLAHLSNGRFDLGLGPQVRANIEDRYGMAFARPVGRLADHMAAIRACFDAFETGEPLGHEGEFHRLTRLQPDFRPAPLGALRRPEVWLGVVGDQMVGLAGRAADGLITHPTSSHPAVIDQRIVPALAAGAGQRDRPVPPLVVSPLVITGADEAAVDESRKAVRRRLAFLYSTPAYRPTLDLMGMGRLGVQLHQLSRDNAWDQLAAVLPDDALDRLAPTARWADLADVFADRYRSRAAGVVVRPPVDGADDDRFAAVVAEIRSI